MISTERKYIAENIAKEALESRHKILGLNFSTLIAGLIYAILYLADVIRDKEIKK